MYKDLPKYKISIDPEFSDGEDLGIEMIAFTATPAIKVKGLAFAADDAPKQFFADKVKNRIVAPAMIPMQIYRCDEEGEYYVEFTVNEIDKINQKFMKKFSNKNVFNLEHNAEDVVPAYILETWIVEDPETDKSFMTYGIKVPKGTLMVTSQVQDSETYTKLVDNEQTGYSIEGFLGLSLSEIINKQKLKQEQMNEEKMSLPAGEYVMGDKTYVVAEDGSFVIKEVSTEMAEEVVEEEVKKEEMADDEIVDEAVDAVEEELAEEVPVVEEEAAVVVETYTKEEVDAKFDEIYKLLGDMKAEEVVEDVAEIVPVAMSIHERFAAINKFNSTEL